MAWVLAPDPDSPYNVEEMEPENCVDREEEQDCRLEDMDPATDIVQ